ncbi:Uncharacterized protein TCM_033979 [Theobroma cacao]|uniref:Uncharacterized protein n=1 Tax=Theobroma cacao TaxID=3641 RepID=A0A061FJP3_THECC|nr:Uncharacterized protein TCM_033979 [Theobroma cacao]
MLLGQISARITKKNTGQPSEKKALSICEDGVFASLSLVRLELALAVAVSTIFSKLFSFFTWGFPEILSNFCSPGRWCTPFSLPTFDRAVQANL